MNTLSNTDIELIESRMGVSIPGLYRKLLVECGHGRIDENHEIYHPEQIRETWESFFDDPSELFTRYFPFGCSPKRQEVWVIRLDDERAATIWHETVPDDWDEEDWISYEDWVAKYLDDASDV